MSKKIFIATIIICVILASSIAVTMAYAQTAPFIPQFSVKFEEHPYDVPPAYGIDPYTGANITVQEGYHVPNQTVTVTIGNQYFASTIGGDNYYLYYNIRAKGHFGEDWTEFYPIDLYHENDPHTYELNLPYTFLSPSSSEYTEVTLPVNYPSDSQVDFQMEAILWRGFQYLVPDTTVVPVPTNSGHYEQRYAFYERSGWGNTQTISIPEQPLVSESPSTSPTHSPTPSSSPSSTPTLTASPIKTPSPSSTQQSIEPTTNLGPPPINGLAPTNLISILIIAAFVIIAVVGFLDYFRKTRKQK
jgi:hypothetical protein